tara:strand:+ start:8385 stop:8711 length:327 start_codon:yes stop_codon:yes gene_type:complete
MTSVLLITRGTKWKSLFHSKLIFTTLTDEHVLRLLLLQKIKLNKGIQDTIKIYLDDLELEEFDLNPKLFNILKYSADQYNINIIDINIQIDKDEISNYNKIVSLKCSK